MARMRAWLVAGLMALTPLAALAQADAPVSAPAALAETAAAKEAAPPVAARTAPVAGIGQPDGGESLQPQMTPIGLEGRWMNDVLLVPMMTGVCVIVFALLGYAIWAFRRRAGRDPSKISHNTTIEVIWTVVPVLILVVIAVPSFQLLANQYDPPRPDLTIKATGHQWYWEYEYPDQGGFSFDSVMLTDDESAKGGTPRLLDVDNRIVVPAGAVVKVLTTSKDVIHAFAIPSFWVQMDAVPGRINETWFKVDKPGVYYGQCYQLCGTRHGFMPIAVEVMPRAAFAAWVSAKQAENGITPKVAAVAVPATQS